MKAGISNIVKGAVSCLAASMLVAACSETAGIRVKVAQAPESDIVVKLLDVNTYKVLDTVRTDASGNFTYKVAVAEGQPEFVYLFHGDTKIASLLLQKGDKVTVEADTLGHYTIEGSEESVKLQQVETDYAQFLKEMADIYEGASAEDLAAGKVTEVNKALSQKYVDYYRKAVSYIMGNPYSLTVVPVLYQSVSDQMQVFNQITDAIHFRRACDSLKTVYPDSKYVKALDKIAIQRENILTLNAKLGETDAMSYPDVVLPDTKGEKVALSSVKSKAVMLMFWTVSEAAQKMFSLDTVKPLYEEFHPKGLEIYSVCIDVDKALWASTVKNQQLPWINVCDGLGTACPALRMYNVAQIPTFFMIMDGEIVNEPIAGVDAVRKYLSTHLK